MGSEENVAELWLVSTTPFFVPSLSLSTHTHTHRKPGLLRYLPLDSLRLNSSSSFPSGPDLAHARPTQSWGEGMLSLLPQLTNHLPHWQEGCEPILGLPLCNHPIYLGPCHTQWGAQGTCHSGYIVPRRFRLTVSHKDWQNSGTVPWLFPGESSPPADRRKRRKCWRWTRTGEKEAEEKGQPPPPWSCSCSGTKVDVSFTYRSPCQHRNCFTQPKVMKYQWASWAHSSCSGRIQHLVVYVSQSRPSYAVVTKCWGICPFLCIFHTHCRSAGGSFQVVLTVEPKYGKLPWQGHKVSWHAHWLLVLLCRTWHWISQGHTATYGQMDRKNSPLRQDGESEYLWTSTFPVGPQQLLSTCPIKNTLGKQKHLHHDLWLE